MQDGRWVAAVFWVAAAYDGILGLIFIFAPAWAFGVMDVPPVNHYGYVRFPAGLLLVFAAMFVRIARDAGANRTLIPYGIGLKLAYCLTVFGYWAGPGISAIWKPFALADLVFIVLFAMAYRGIGRH
ncbi:MAG: hypothetical protein GTN89_04620 [Acidobacteria bacterium]|nr:hypothetical protein [Acidobacteriota bacterium]NIM60429.1 hypothetical protein [Acidobacteriota bacterium]NIO58604.1 hypothetical protein [Acidobacteriota bacterium]NIQ29656.1 hypothetical protein [Acidobacteriota bacterium]NIQ84373.1 hypothetical protein [Acidobacteriota bacterium]